MTPIDPQFQPLENYPQLSDEETQHRALDFLKVIKTRRTVRDFSSQPVPREVIEDCLRAAGCAPSGANLQPWRFVVVSDPAIKRRIRLAAEEEERTFYEERAPQDWLDALAPLGTDWRKPFLDTAPYLIAIFGQKHSIGPNGTQVKNYYVQESVGIATGFLITALHLAGLATLTHTPSPMGFLNDILGRPVDERPFLLLVVGHPEENARVPVIQKKALDQIAIFV